MMVQLPAGTDEGSVNENHAVLLDPSGAIAWDYQKSKPTPGDGHGPGPGVVPSVDTPYGRLATIICQDDFFPGLVRQAGAAGVDILLVPSSDWESLAAWHAQQTAFRAIENGMALVRPTRQGISLASDGQGRLLGHKADYFVSEDQTLVVSVPTRGNDDRVRRRGRRVRLRQCGRTPGPGGCRIATPAQPATRRRSGTKGCGQMSPRDRPSSTASWRDVAPSLR